MVVGFLIWFGFFAVFSLQVRSMPNSPNGYVTLKMSYKEEMDMFLLNWTEFYFTGIYIQLMCYVCVFLMVLLVCLNFCFNM